MSAPDKTKGSSRSRNDRNYKFPTPVRELREKHPDGPLVRAHITMPNGRQSVILEGRLDEQFLKVARAMLDAASSN